MCLGALPGVEQSDDTKSAATTAALFVFLMWIL
jgi:hypothetical protein